MGDEIPFQITYSKDHFKTIFISIHASSQCNMKCKYRFMQNRHDVNIAIDEVKRYIDFNIFLICYF